MSGNTYGKLFKVTTYGESHGKALGCIIDGCPPQLEISTEEIQTELNRRKPGQSDVTTQRKESDRVEILSGIFEGKTTGTPISLIIYNEDQRSQDYSIFKIHLDRIMLILHTKQNMVIETTGAAVDQVPERQL